MRIRLTFALVLAWVTPAGAASIIVPDQAPTIQAALEARVDTVLVRPGAYAETAVVRYGVTLMGMSDGSANRPSLLGLTTHNESWGPHIFSGLQVLGPVSLGPGGWSEFAFKECDLRGGVRDSLENYYLHFTKCDITGPLKLWVDVMSLDSCNVTGGGVINEKDGSIVDVRGCTIQGGGVYCPSDNGCTVEGSTIRGGGIRSRADGATVSNNLIEDYAGNAIAIEKGTGVITRNMLRRCANGIVAAGGSVSIVENTIASMQETGILIFDSDASITGNVIWRSGISGLVMENRERFDSQVRNNTSCLNGASGFVSTQHEREEQRWSGNIAYGNGAYGVSFRPGVGPLLFSCNDWFGNRMGDVEGMPFPASDFSVDPLFCDAPNGDLRLSATSPLFEMPGCGQIGALGIGCGLTKGRAKVRPRFAIAEVTPNPGSEPLRVSFTLAHAAAIEIDVFDVMGRRIVSLAKGEWQAGTHAVQWDGLARDGRPAPQGMYLLRYTHPGGQDKRTIVRLR